MRLPRWLAPSSAAEPCTFDEICSPRRLPPGSGETATARRWCRRRCARGCRTRAACAGSAARCGGRAAPRSRCPGRGRGGAVTEHPEDGSQELVRGGADRALVAPTHHQRLVLRTELAVVRPSGSVRVLDEHGAQHLVPAPSASRPAFASALVVAQAHAGPGCEAAGGAEPRHIGSGLDQDGASRTSSVSRTYEFELDDLADASTRDRLKWAFSDPDRLRPGETKQSLTERVAASSASVAGRCASAVRSAGGGALRQPARLLHVRRRRRPASGPHFHADATACATRSGALHRAGRLCVRGDGHRRSRRLRDCGLVQRRLVRRQHDAADGEVRHRDGAGAVGPGLVGDRPVDPRHAVRDAASIPASVPSSGRTTRTGTRYCWSSRWWSARCSSSGKRRRPPSRSNWNARRPPSPAQRGRNGATRPSSGTGRSSSGCARSRCSIRCAARDTSATRRCGCSRTLSTPEHSRPRPWVFQRGFPGDRPGQRQGHRDQPVRGGVVGIGEIQWYAATGFGLPGLSVLHVSRLRFRFRPPLRRQARFRCEPVAAVPTARGARPLTVVDATVADQSFQTLS